MAKEPQQTPEEPIIEFDDTNFEPQKTDFGLIAPKTVESEMEQSYLDYAMSVIVSRA